MSGIKKTSDEVWGVSVLEQNEKFKDAQRELNKLYKEWLRLILNRPNRNVILRGICE